MLLRQANLWSDSLNTRTPRTDTISDVTDYWYGYAQKAISMGLITKNPDNSIRPDEFISRGEFAIMAARTLEFSQCNTTFSRHTIAAEIIIRDEAGIALKKSVFTQ